MADVGLANPFPLRAQKQERKLIPFVNPTVRLLDFSVGLWISSLHIHIWTAQRPYWYPLTFLSALPCPKLCLLVLAPHLCEQAIFQPCSAVTLFPAECLAIHVQINSNCRSWMNVYMVSSLPSIPTPHWRLGLEQYTQIQQNCLYLMLALLHKYKHSRYF